jgi:hypothetical protein
MVNCQNKKVKKGGQLNMVRILENISFCFQSQVKYSLGLLQPINYLIILLEELMMINH